MSSKTTKVFILIAGIAIGSYWYWSPFLAIHNMKQAAEQRDADSFNQYVDYAKLRESLKGQFAALLAKEMAKSDTGSSAEKAGAALGNMIGLAFVDKIVDTMVRPEVVMKAMEQGKMEKPGKESDTSSKPKDYSDPKWDFERKGVDKLIAYSVPTSESDSRRIGLVFERTGFSTWKLTELRISLEK